MSGLIQDTIKIGKTTYEVKSGDYVLQDGKDFKFCTGDKRELKKGVNIMDMPTTLVKKMRFLMMHKLNFTKTDENGNQKNLTKYYF